MSDTALAREDPFFRTGDQIPLGRPFGVIETVAATPSRPGIRPFGLGFATTASAVTVDVLGLRYDPTRQLGLIVPGGKHSTGQTNTRTSDGHQGMDSDTDHTED